MAVLCDSAERFLSLADGRFDYVVCGGGTAGLVVAARLTEDPNVTVGVIEAGKNRMDDPRVKIPAAAMQMVSQPDFDWMLQSIPQVRASIYVANIFDS